MRKSNLVYIILAFVLLLNRMQGQETVASFPVVANGKVRGTAFLIDKEYGWFLTAAHVLSESKLSSMDDKVVIRFVIKFVTGNETEEESQDIPLQIVAL